MIPDLTKLNPFFLSRLQILFQEWIKAGILFKIIDAVRTYETQKTAYESGKPGTVPPWESWHVKKAAVDVEFPLGFREKARSIAGNLGFFVIDEDRFGYSHLHIDGRNFVEPEIKPVQSNAETHQNPLRAVVVIGFCVLIYKSISNYLKNDEGGYFDLERESDI